MDNKIIVHGLNVKETQTGENDKLITLITPEYGKICVIGKGIKSIKSKNMVASQQFSYSNYVLKEYHNFYYIQETELIECFYNLRNDLNKLTLASYLCDVCEDVTMENQPDPEILQLTLNSLYALCNRDDKISKIKAAFEFRMSSLCGFCPDLTICDICSKDANGDYYLDVMNGRLLCRECKPIAEKEAIIEDTGEARLYYLLNKPILEAMRHIILSSPQKFLSFNLDDDDLYLLSKFTEGYLINHLEHTFKTLDFYKSIL